MQRRQLIEAAVRRGKYAPLFHHLTSQGGDHLDVTFKELERVLGFALPVSARIYRPWWANQAKSGHSQAMAWSAAGWKTAAVDLEGERLRFERIRPTSSKEEDGSADIGKSSFQYWVYENWTHDKAIIHKASCCYCQNGRGMHVFPKGDRNGHWLGPKYDLAEAERVANATGRRLVATCKVCIGR